MGINKQQHLKNARRVVVKIGSGVLTLNHGLNLAIIETISDQISRLMDGGCQVILVSSGAIAAGVKRIGLERRPDGIPARQAAAAVGQAGLILSYDRAFDRHGKKVAQLLLTRDDLSNRRRYLNARNTINTLLDWKIVPIINENDTVVIEEIKLGDNDNLSAMIALLMDADILINLTDIDGLFDRDPRIHSDASLIKEVTTITRAMEQAACGIPGNLGTGGMLSKLKAAKKLSKAGIPMIIAGGKNENVLSRLVAGESLGTYFLPGKKELNLKKCWIAYNLKPQGGIRLDEGARAAVMGRGKSILPVGITDVEGEFGVGASIEIKASDNTVIGCGLANYSSADLRRIMGLKTAAIKYVLGSKPYDDAIHRDNLAITADCDNR